MHKKQFKHIKQQNNDKTQKSQTKNLERFTQYLKSQIKNINRKTIFWLIKQMFSMDRPSKNQLLLNKTDVFHGQTIEKQTFAWTIGFTLEAPKWQCALELKP